MAYDERLADRVRDLIGDRPGLAEKKMFGGLAFLLNGNMACGVHGEELIVRLSADASDAALAEPATRVFDLSGRPMKGWILVGTQGCATKKELKRWVDRGVAHAGTLPPK